MKINYQDSSKLVFFQELYREARAASEYIYT